MMAETYFMDLPVYRLPPEKYQQQMEELLAAQIAEMERFPGYTVSRETRMAMSQHQYETFGPWRFNEVIGYIRLFVLGTQIRGEYFSAEKKRNPLSRRKVFTFRTLKLAPEINLFPPHPNSNAEIFAAVVQYVEDCRGELAKTRFIDDSVLMTVGPHIDWRALVYPARPGVTA